MTIKILLKKSFCIIAFIFLLLLVNQNVYAENIPESPSVSSNDYELICTYNDGAELTITKDNIYLVNMSSSAEFSNNSAISFFLTEDQKNVRDTDGKVTKSNADLLLRNSRHCPSKLYVYKVSSKEDSNVEEDMKLDGIYNYYYSTKSGIAEEVSSKTKGCGFLWLNDCVVALAEEVSNTNLVSEEANLYSSKTTTICDYAIKSDNDSLSSSSVSIYLYAGIHFLDNGTRTTPLQETFQSCPASLSKEELEQDNPKGTYLYINDPIPKMVGTNTSGNYKYNHISFYASTDSETCKANNDGNACTQYQFIGSRSGDSGDNSEIDVCKLLGNKTIVELKKIISALQIIVPALLMVLISLDITKMVLAGNLTEELPKKKKSILIRLIVMLLFFFAPVIAELIIKLLADANVNIGDIECFIK